MRWLWEFLVPYCIQAVEPSPAVQLPVNAQLEQQGRRLSTVVVQPDASQPTPRELSLRKTSSDLLPMKSVLSRAVKEAAADSERRQERGRGRERRRAHPEAPETTTTTTSKSRIRERPLSPTKGGGRTGKRRNTEVGFCC